MSLLRVLAVVVFDCLFFLFTCFAGFTFKQPNTNFIFNQFLLRLRQNLWYPRGFQPEKNGSTLLHYTATNCILVCKELQLTNISEM